MCNNKLLDWISANFHTNSKFLQTHSHCWILIYYIVRLVYSICFIVQSKVTLSSGKTSFNDRTSQYRLKNAAVWESERTETAKTVERSERWPQQLVPHSHTSSSLKTLTHTHTHPYPLFAYVCNMLIQLILVWINSQSREGAEPPSMEAA